MAMIDPMTAEVVPMENAGSAAVALSVCAKEGHRLVTFNQGKWNDHIRCSSCGMTLEEIRKGELIR